MPVYCAYGFQVSETQKKHSLVGIASLCYLGSQSYLGPQLGRFRVWWWHHNWELGASWGLFTHMSGVWGWSTQKLRLLIRAPTHNLTMWPGFLPAWESQDSHLRSPTPSIPASRWMLDHHFLSPHLRNYIVTFTVFCWWQASPKLSQTPKK